MTSDDPDLADLFAKDPPVVPWDELAPRLFGLLDHESDRVRARAASLIGECYDRESGLTVTELFSRIGALELERPGVAAPFWSMFQIYGPQEQAWDGVGEWLLDLFEHRKGIDPPDLVVDLGFHIHEACSFEPDAVRRLVRLGAKDVALMTATEEPIIVPGMEDALLELAHDDDPHVAAGARQHLARNYWRVALDTVASGALTRHARWPEAAAIHVARSERRDWDNVVVTPPPRHPLAGDRAEEMIDEILPSDVRRDLRKVDDPGARGLYLFAYSVERTYDSGAVVRFHGEHMKAPWDSIEIIGRGILGQWNPQALLAIPRAPST